MTNGSCNYQRNSRNGHHGICKTAGTRGHINRPFYSSSVCILGMMVLLLSTNLFHVALANKINPTSASSSLSNLEITKKRSLGTNPQVEIMTATSLFSGDANDTSMHASSRKLSSLWSLFSFVGKGHCIVGPAGKKCREEHDLHHNGGGGGGGAGGGGGSGSGSGGGSGSGSGGGGAAGGGGGSGSGSGGGGAGDSSGGAGDSSGGSGSSGGTGGSTGSSGGDASSSSISSASNGNNGESSNSSQQNNKTNHANPISNYFQSTSGKITSIALAALSASVAVAAMFMNYRNKNQAPKHALHGMIKKRIGLFSRMANRTRCGTCRPERVQEVVLMEEGDMTMDGTGRRGSSATDYRLA